MPGFIREPKQEPASRTQGPSLNEVGVVQPKPVKDKPVERDDNALIIPDSEHSGLQLEPQQQPNIVMMTPDPDGSTFTLEPQEQTNEMSGAANGQEAKIQMVPDIQKEGECPALSVDHSVTMHTVDAGENTWSIARAYWPVSTDTFIGEVVACITELNGVEEGATIFPGDSLRIPIPVTGGEASEPVTPSEGPDQSVEPGTETEGPNQSIDPGTETEEPDQSIEPGTEIDGPTQSIEPGTETETPEPGEESVTAATGLEPSHVAGDLIGTKIIRLALTVDDGPTSARSEQMNDNLGDINATWYVQYDKVLQDETDNFRFLLEVQNAGGEIAIHSFHPTSNHAVWFPIPDAPHDSYSFPYEGQTEDFIMNDTGVGLQGFYNRLIAEGIQPKFVRLPGGLISELTLYARRVGIADSGDFASNLINGGDISAAGEKGAAIKDEYDVLKAKLSSLELLLWRGDAEPLEIHNLSWEAESASGPDTIPASFISLAGRMRDGTDRSLVILTHDTKDKYVTGFDEDIKAMEAYAATNGVRIEYYTMSQLFQLETGEDPATIDVQY